jgi:2-dehydro-3-deoxyphosphogluconate aldolase/(4S)-4-hydroxy-2-oxoglutarate aldolase
VLEITLTVPDALGVLRSLAARFAGRAIIGAGTVLGAEHAKACIDVGAAFLVSPGLDPAMIEVARARDVAAIPGVLTPTEVMAAMKAGADMVKVFPCSAVGGPKYLRALRAPFPHVKLLPTGGVTAANAYEYFSAGAVALGIGSELVDPSALQAGKDSELAERARALLAAVCAARSRLAG